jgi:hypothetical protein
LAKIYNVYEPYPFFHFNNSEITVFCRKDGVVESFDLPQVPLKEMRIDADSEYVTIFMRRENQRFNFTQETTVYRGVRFVNMSATVKSDVEGVSIDWVQFVMHTKGAAMQNDKTVALIDQNMRVLGQLIFTEGRPKVFTITTENPSALELRYNLEGKPSGEVELFVGVYQLGFEEIKADCVDKIVADNLVSYMDVVADLPFDVFDYQHVLQENDISYIACRDSDVIAKFAEDPVFSLVFINDDVAVFSVKRGFSQLGRKPLP